MHPVVLVGTHSGRKQLGQFLKFLQGNFDCYDFLQLNYPNVSLALSYRSTYNVNVVNLKLLTTFQKKHFWAFSIFHLKQNVDTWEPIFLWTIYSQHSYKQWNNDNLPLIMECATMKMAMIMGRKKTTECSFWGLEPSNIWQYGQHKYNIHRKKLNNIDFIHVIVMIVTWLHSVSEK